MNETVTIKKLIAALRDTSSKATETDKIKVPNGRLYGEDQFSEQYTDRYSRDWIAGRLLGMADTLEAMTGPDADLLAAQARAADIIAGIKTGTAAGPGNND